jgi:hypothetical protein
MGFNFKKILITGIDNLEFQNENSKIELDDSTKI